MNRQGVCIVCRRFTRNRDVLLCDECDEDYDAWRNSPANTGDALALISWAASRSRLMLIRSQQAKEF